MDGDRGELRPAYRTLDEPTRLLGLSVAGWATLLAVGGAAYGWLMVSPLPWRLNFSLAAIVLGAPTALGLLREQSTISPARLLGAIVRWRMRPATVVAVSVERPLRRGGVRLDEPPSALAEDFGEVDEFSWLDAGEPGEVGG